ncbi:hypothetical protein TKK_0015996 [Trichogramma kaykai]|uniref:Skp1-related protein n=1 Tax=Trichogramma kaykai TaxID=54128 RepID=A0ABD2W8N7_9HYME
MAAVADNIVLFTTKNVSNQNMHSKIKLQSSDCVYFLVEIKAAYLSTTIKKIAEDSRLSNGDKKKTIFLPSVNGATLKKVIEWCTHHQDDLPYIENDDPEKKTDKIPSWDANFLKVDHFTLYDIMLAANYLKIKGLLDLACRAMAKSIKDKGVQQIRKDFNIKNDYTPMEEEQVRKENEWCENK